MIESGKVVSSHSSRWGTTSRSRKRRTWRRSSSCASVKYIGQILWARDRRPGRLDGALRYDCARLVGVGCFPADKQVCTGVRLGSVIKKRRKKMRKHKHRKMLKKTRWQRRAHA